MRCRSHCLSASIAAMGVAACVPWNGVSIFFSSGAKFTTSTSSCLGCSARLPSFKFRTRLPSLQRRFRLPCVYDPPGKVEFPSLEEDEEVGPDVIVPQPPTEGRIDIVINKALIQQLDLSPAEDVLRNYIQQTGDNAQRGPIELLQRTVGFGIDYEWDDPLDLRELSEMPDMSKRKGLVFNPEGLELFFMNKLFTVYPWLHVLKVAKADAKEVSKHNLGEAQWRI